jgi:hypothetical protein
MSIARHHNEWLTLVPNSGPFVSLPVLMKAFPQGLYAHDAEHARRLRMAFEEWDDNQSSLRPDQAIHRAWIKLALAETLGFEELFAEGQHIQQTLKTIIAEYGVTLRPDMVVNDPNTKKARLLVQTYPRAQQLGKPVQDSRWKTSPDTRMMQLLHDTGIRLGIVTNGDQWLLVNAPRGETTGYASWYSSLWFEEPLTLRAYRTLLCAERFFGVPDNETIEALLDRSSEDQQEVTDLLGYQVRKAVVVLIQALDKADQDHGRKLLADLKEEVLYEAALTVMMRLVFLFCAEERELLLLGDDLWDRNYAVSSLREQLRTTADQFGEEILGLRYDAWTRLLTTFRAVYAGVKHDRFNLPAYGGNLFNPDRFPFLEGRMRDTCWRESEATPLPVNNRTVLHLLEALQVLQVRLPGGGPAEARRLSFRSLDIEQIGQVYEGLLDHTAKRATEPVLGFQGTRDKEPEIPLAELERIAASGEEKFLEFLKEETGRSEPALKKALKAETDIQLLSRFRTACQGDEALWKRVEPFAGLVRFNDMEYPEIITTGSVFVTAGTDRRSSGTHYTPRSLTEPVVQYTLEPLVYVGPAEGMPKEQWNLRSAKELLDLKVCDKTCGSGAFLVQVCRYLSERLLEAWEEIEKIIQAAEPQHREWTYDAQEIEKVPIAAESEESYVAGVQPELKVVSTQIRITPYGEPATGHPSEQIVPQDMDERIAFALRIVAQRCLYGVDKNPLAVEMAKLSLWLLTLAKDKPFEFLDHAIRCGDSLVGIHNLDQLRRFSLDGKGEDNNLFLHFLDPKIKEAIALRRQITERQANTVEDVEAQDRMLQEANEKIDWLKCAADFLIAAEFTPGSAADKRAARDDAAIKVAAHFNDSDLPTFRREAQKALAGQVTFHWPLEFPETMVERGGFDAFVGNPPFMGGRKISSNFGDEYEHYLKKHLLAGAKGTLDLVLFFLVRGATNLRQNGIGGFIATDSICESDNREIGMPYLFSRVRPIRAVASHPWPGVAGVRISRIHFIAGQWSGAKFIGDVQVDSISTMLDSSVHLNEPHQLLANAGFCSDGIKVQGIGFVMSEEEAQSIISVEPQSADVIVRYIVGDDINNHLEHLSERRVINFWDRPESECKFYRIPWKLVIERVKPYRDGLTKQVHEECFWKFWDRREAFFDRVRRRDTIFVCSKLSKHLGICRGNPNHIFSEKAKVFDFSTYTAFAVLQSSFHIIWSLTWGSSTGETPAYVGSRCFDTFPFPPDFYNPGKTIMLDTEANNRTLEEAGATYYALRRRVILNRRECLTKTYNRFHDPNEKSDDIQKFRLLHIEMDNAVAAAYGWTDLGLGYDFHETKQGVRYTISEINHHKVMARLLKLNHERHEEEVRLGLHESKASAGKGKRQAKAHAGGATLFDSDENV